MKPVLSALCAALLAIPGSAAAGWWGPALPDVAVREIHGQPTSFTPYDRYLGVVREVIARTKGRPAPFERAGLLTAQAHAFRYETRDPHRPDPPELTAKRRAGDCKAKSLWLLRELNDPAALFVIGAAPKKGERHAWLYWWSGGRWWVLDPTRRAMPIEAGSPVGRRYVPYYSYGKDGAFRHKATAIFHP